MLVTGLKGINYTENLSGVTASGSWVRKDKADCLLWVNDEDRTDSECNALGVNVCGILVVEPDRLISTRYTTRGILWTVLTCHMHRQPFSPCHR